MNTSMVKNEVTKFLPNAKTMLIDCHTHRDTDIVKLRTAEVQLQVSKMETCFIYTKQTSLTPHYEYQAWYKDETIESLLPLSGCILGVLSGPQCFSLCLEYVRGHGGRATYDPNLIVFDRMWRKSRASADPLRGFKG